MAKLRRGKKRKHLDEQDSRLFKPVVSDLLRILHDANTLPDEKASDLLTQPPDRKLPA